MKKFLFLALVVFALFASCASSEDDPDINGTWVLSKVGGVSVSQFFGLFDITIVVTDSSKYTSSGTIFGFPFSETGTVAAKSEFVYTFTDSEGTATDYTLSDDGESLTTQAEDDGEMTTLLFTKS